MGGGWSHTSNTSSSCSTWSKKANSTLWLSALTICCIFLLGYQTGILPRCAPGVRLGGEERICASSSCVSREKPTRRKYARSAMPSNGFAILYSSLKRWAVLVRRIPFYPQAYHSYSIAANLSGTQRQIILAKSNLWRKTRLPKAQDSSSIRRTRPGYAVFGGHLMP